MTPYEELCALADRLQARVRLGWDANGWALEVVCGSSASPSERRGIAFVFPGFDELQRTARMAAVWLTGHCS